MRDELEPFAPSWRRRDLVALARQQRLEDLAHDLLVVDDENRCRVVHRVMAASARAASARPAPRERKRQP